jgi:hypothetical protein
MFLSVDRLGAKEHNKAAEALLPSPLHLHHGEVQQVLLTTALGMVEPKIQHSTRRIQTTLVQTSQAQQTQVELMVVGVLTPAHKAEAMVNDLVKTRRGSQNCHFVVRPDLSLPIRL